MIIGTYRLQLNKGFTFYDTIENLDYFKELGVSHLPRGILVNQVNG
ncbi:Malto-oligosyltrehalose synthase [Saccharolobus shibatae]|uniref:Malto-oligosyltrehalose synthase n=1 Tax=Saccharolobus shibatae TaxID=2286 RepID=A0A8F5GWZ9_9CREN|nr:Malto-oligosyltrehalose synthase [Saccharolobus shibatae]